MAPIYISFDMDALDPPLRPAFRIASLEAYQPGSDRAPAGHQRENRGRDIVEFNPAQDNTQLTATVAAKLLKEILGKMVLN